MEDMTILSKSYFHDIAVKRLVFLSHTPSNSSALCALLFVQKCVSRLSISHVIDVREIVFVHGSYHINAATPQKFIET